MNLEKIKEILAKNDSADYTRHQILKVIADDKQAIPYLLEILAAEREEKDELILDSNAELSRALVTIDDKHANTKKQVVDSGWVVQQIKIHYLKWQHRIHCCFKFQDLP
jgi:hypothetical protein